jgi:hypothetical protein
MSKTIQQKIEEVTAMAERPGNYDCSPYMWGMANGLILARAICRDEEPKYLDAPPVWLDDKRTTLEPKGTTEGKPDAIADLADDMKRTVGP